MHAILNTFKSGVGDCVFMRLIKDDATFSIMIDCGKYTPEINLFIKEKLHKQFHPLIYNSSFRIFRKKVFRTFLLVTIY